MSLFASRAGYVLAVIYLAIAGYTVRFDLNHIGGDWISLPGMGTFIITLPSQGTLGVLLKATGVPAVNFRDPGLLGYGQLLTHILLTATLVYLLGFGVEWGVRRLIA